MARSILSPFTFGGTAPFVYVMTIPGQIGVGSGQVRLPIHRSITVTNVRVMVGTAPTGASMIFDVNKNGTTIFTTQGNRPTIAISGNADNASVPDVTAFAAGDYITVDVDQVGSTIQGSDAVVEIEYY